MNEGEKGREKKSVIKITVHTKVPIYNVPVILIVPFR